MSINEKLELKFDNVYNEDCMITMKRIADKSVNLIIADFPYYEVKGDFDFIWKDFNEFLVWVEDCAKQFKRILAENGSLFVYGHAKKIAYKQIIFDKYFNLENHIIWEKKDCQTRLGLANFRCFAPIKEHILFYSNEMQMTGLEMIDELHIKPNNPFSKYLKEEFKRAGATRVEIAKLFLSKSGKLTGCVGNWLSGDNIITKEQYHKIKKYLNKEFANDEYLRKEYEDLRKEYEDLRKEYEDLRKEYEDLRRPFENTKYTDVLKFSQESNITGKYKHPTQKPPKLTRVLIETTTREKDIVYIPFGGAGVELEQSEVLNRKYIGSEICINYFNIIQERLKKAKGEIGLFANLNKG